MAYIDLSLQTHSWIYHNTDHNTDAYANAWNRDLKRAWEAEQEFLRRRIWPEEEKKRANG